VEKRTTDGYIWMGTAVRFLRDIDETYYVYKPGFVLGNIRDLTEHLDQYEMHVTRRVADVLVEFERDRMDELQKAQKDDPETDLEETRMMKMEEVVEVVEAARQVQTTMLAEAEGQVAFITRDSSTMSEV
jgi:hypothetical protein